MERFKTFSLANTIEEQHEKRLDILHQRSRAFITDNSISKEHFPHQEHFGIDSNSVKLAISTLPIEEDEKVLVLWSNKTLVLTKWNTITEGLDYFYKNDEDILIWPLSEKWCARYNNSGFNFGVTKESLK